MSLLAHNFRIDTKNLGMAGSCLPEKEIAKYIADESKKGGWDVLTLKLGINAVLWEDDRIRERSEYFIKTVAEKTRRNLFLLYLPFITVVTVLMKITLVIIGEEF